MWLKVAPIKMGVRLKGRARVDQGEIRLKINLMKNHQKNTFIFAVLR